MRKYWTHEDKDVIKRMISDNKSFREISKALNRSSSSIGHYASRNGLISKFTFRKYNVNHNFWTIPNPVNSFHAGFGAADTCAIQRSENSFIYQMLVATKDREYLEGFVKDCQFTGPIKDVLRKPPKTSNPLKKLYGSVISISSSQWGKDLRNNFNIIPNKTKRLAPPEQLNDELLCYFLKGYICGDGNLHYNKHSEIVNLSFVSSSKYMMEWVKIFTDKMWPKSLKNTTCNIRTDKRYNCWHYAIGGVRAAAIIDYLHQLSISALSRKWNNPAILDYINKNKLKHPHLFYTYKPNILPNETSALAPNSVISKDESILV